MIRKLHLRASSLALLPAVTLLLAGCADLGVRKQDVGMVIGGAAGGIAGAQIGGGRGRTAAIITGTLLGAVVGGAVGRSMDDVDRMKTAHTLETVRTGVPATWQNPDTGAQYTVTPTKTYETPAGPCREYVVQALIGGEQEEVYGTACRQPDGSWQAQN